MGAVRTGRVVSEALDPVLVPAGFLSGQYGEGGEDVDRDTQVIFCATAREFSARYPRLPQAGQQDVEGACVDLVIEVESDRRLTRIDLEGTSLEGTLRHVGLITMAEDVARADGGSLVDGLPAIEAALRALFEIDPRAEH